MIDESSLRVSSVEEIIDAVRGNDRLIVRGAGTKSNLSAASDGEGILDLSEMRGILEYDPGEYTFTALAGTPLSEVNQALAEHGQYLPFDPPLVTAGATLGGTVASGLSGSGRQRYGGVRDFLLGVHFVDGQGRAIHGGGKVVKNAAGFDLPKLMVGSLGRLGVLAELTFKVFPRPRAYHTLQRDYAGLAAALRALAALAPLPLELDGLDLVIDEGDGSCRLLLRVGGLPEVLTARLARLQETLGGGVLLDDEQDGALWREGRELTWRAGAVNLAKVPLVIDAIEGLEAELGVTGAGRRYIAGGNQAWIAWPGDPHVLDAILHARQLAGLMVLGTGSPARMGAWRGQTFLGAVKGTLDPDGRFPAFD